MEYTSREIVEIRKRIWNALHPTAASKEGNDDRRRGPIVPGAHKVPRSLDTGALGKVLMIILVYAARISEGKRFPPSLSLSLSKECGSSCTRRYDHVWVIGCEWGTPIAHMLRRRWAWASRGTPR